MIQFWQEMISVYLTSAVGRLEGRWQIEEIVKKKDLQDLVVT